MIPLLLGALVFFLFFLIFYVLWSAFLIYHLLRFAPRRDTARVHVAVFLVVSALLLALAAVALWRADWSAPLFSVGTRF